MTIESLINRSDYVGNGSTASYDYEFKIFEDTDLLVVVADEDGVETTLVLNTDYTVAGEGDEVGGSITLLDDDQDWIDDDGFLATGYALTLRRVMPLTQETDISNQGPYYASLHEEQFDKLICIDQQQQEELDRSLKVPETEEDLTELPSATDRASKFLAFDAAGEPIASAGGISPAIPVSAFMQTVLDDANSTVVRTTIDAVSEDDVNALIADAIADLASQLYAPGDIKMTGKSTATIGWLMCDSSAVSRTTYADLFSVIGTAFGSGNGLTTFNVPDLRGRSPLGMGHGSTAEGGGTGTDRVLGTKVGAETHTLIEAELAGHNHQEKGNPNSVYNVSGAGAFKCLAQYGTGSTGAAGGNGSHNNMQPSLVVNFMIKT